MLTRKMRVSVVGSLLFSFYSISFTTFSTKPSGSGIGLSIYRQMLMVAKLINIATQRKNVLDVAGARSDSLLIVYSRCKGRKIGVQPSCKDSASEWNESLLSNSRAQPILSKASAKTRSKNQF